MVEADAVPSPTIFAEFPLIFIVNLPNRADRRRESNEELAPLRLKAGQAEFFPATKPSEPAGFPTLGARGCFVSHLAVLREAQRRGLAQILIFEDDFHVPNARLLEAIEVPEYWDFLYLGHRLDLPVSDRPQVLQTSEPLMTTHAYAVHSRQFQPLIDYLAGCLTREPGDPVGGPMHVDGALSMFRAAHPEALTFVTNPSLVTQRSSASDVTTHWVDRLPVVGKLLRKVLR